MMTSRDNKKTTYSRKKKKNRVGPKEKKSLLVREASPSKGKVNKRDWRKTMGSSRGQTKLRKQGITTSSCVAIIRCSHRGTSQISIKKKRGTKEVPYLAEV